MEYEYVKRSSLLQINLIGISFSWPAFILIEYLILVSTWPYIISLKENDGFIFRDFLFLQYLDDFCI